MTTTAVTTTMTIDVAGIGPVGVTVEDRGDGRPFLVLHGGAGPQSVAEFAQLLAEKDHNRVLTPTHPGFGGTPRPEGLNSVAGLAALYGGLLDDLGLEHVTVIGNSVGGRIAAEMALLGSPRISAMVLLDAVGIEVEGHSVADVSGLSVPEIQALSFHDPTSFRVDPASIPDAQKAIMAANGAALASMPAPRRWPTLRCSGASAASLSGPSCCGARAIRLSSLPTARPMPLPSTGRASR
jgi:pimeloyl-ACP methyl ester carboxylesterase